VEISVGKRSFQLDCGISLQHSILPTSISSKLPKQRKKVQPTRIGELGEYKINIQLDQLPKDCKYLSDLLVSNSKSRTGYSQIDHLVISPYGLFVIETKNYSGEIKGKRDDKNWIVNNRFKMFNPLRQNYGHVKAIESITQSYKKLNFISMISFTMRCRFSIDPELRQISSNELVIYDVELSEFINRKLIRLSAENPEPFLKNEDIIHIYNLLVKANILDPKIRIEHVEKASDKKQKSVGVYS
jgi:hypothetical protein